MPGAYNVSYDGSAARYWYSNQFADQYGLDALATATALLTKYLKNANIGANFSPLTYDPSAYTTAAYLYTVNKGVRAFRSGALTLPWGEDYSWQTPIGSQQMTTLLLDFFRAGKRHGTTKTTTQTMFYTMAHAPGNTPTSWRRNFYGNWAHGMTMLNLYELRPTISSYTENYVATGWGMYTEVRKALSELASFEDLVQSGRVVDGDVGLWCSDAFDIWGRATPPSSMRSTTTFTSAARAPPLLHAELPVDVVVDDVGAALNSLAHLPADTHVPDALAASPSGWRQAARQAAAGAGMFNELNQTNTALRALLGVTPTAMIEPTPRRQHQAGFGDAAGNVTWAANGSMNQSAIFARDVFRPAADRRCSRGTTTVRRPRRCAPRVAGVPFSSAFYPGSATTRPRSRSGPPIAAAPTRRFPTFCRPTSRWRSASSSPAWRRRRVRSCARRRRSCMGGPSSRRRASSCRWSTGSARS